VHQNKAQCTNLLGAEVLGANAGYLCAGMGYDLYRVSEVFVPKPLVGMSEKQ